MAKKPAPAPAFEPYLVNDPYTRVRGPWLGKWLVTGRTALGAVVAVGRTVHLEGVSPGVVHRIIEAHQLPNYRRVEDENSSLQSILEGIKNEALTHGATPLAVEWLNNWILFNDKEMNIMADKLKTKAPAKKAEAKTPAKGKGNPEALAKARAAKAEAGPDTRKITVLKKDHGARAGTARAALLDTIFKSKTVQAAVDAGVKKSDVSWAARADYISLG